MALLPFTQWLTNFDSSFHSLVSCPVSLSPKNLCCILQQLYFQQRRNQMPLYSKLITPPFHKKNLRLAILFLSCDKGLKRLLSNLASFFYDVLVSIMLSTVVKFIYLDSFWLIFYFLIMVDLLIYNNHTKLPIKIIQTYKIYFFRSFLHVYLFFEESS